MNIEHNKIALFDMDGTLFDYEGQLRQDLSKLAWPNEPNYLDLNVNVLELEHTESYLKARIDLIKSKPGWWRDLPKLNDGWRIFKMAKEIGFHCQILTKGPSSRPYVWQEKVECIRKHFAPGEVESINITEDKSIHYGRVLVDDFPNYMDSWMYHRCRGLGIMPANINNMDYQHPNVLRVNMKDMYDDWGVYEALVAAFKRGPKEHWKNKLEQS